MNIDEIIQQAAAIDGHFDLTYDLLNRYERGERNIVRDIYLPNYQKGGFAGCISAIFIDNHHLPEMGLRRALEQIACLYRERDEHPGLFRICKTVADFEAARAAGEFAIFLSLEGADPIGNNIHYLRIFYELGVRALGLVWARRSQVGDGYFLGGDANGDGTRFYGLSHFGLDLIAEAEHLGMVVDISHLADAGVDDVIAHAKKPFVASHSNCRSLASHKRNLTDAQIRAIANGGGVVGMNAIQAFIDDDGSKVSINRLIDHVDHVVNLGGVETVALGFDLCDSFKNDGSYLSTLDTSDLFKGHHELPLLVEGLLARAYKEEEIIKILGDNLRRVYREVCG